MLNGSGVQGVAGTTGTALTARGFHVLGASGALTSTGAPDFSYVQSVVQYGSTADLAAARTVAAQLTNVTLQLDPSVSAGTVNLVLGSDFTALAPPTSQPPGNLAKQYSGYSGSTNVCRGYGTAFSAAEPRPCPLQAAPLQPVPLQAALCSPCRARESSPESNAAPLLLFDPGAGLPATAFARELCVVLPMLVVSRRQSLQAVDPLRQRLKPARVAKTLPRSMGHGGMHPPFTGNGSRGRHGSRAVAWVAVGLAALLVAGVLTGYVAFREVFGKIHQVNVTRPGQPAAQVQQLAEHPGDRLGHQAGQERAGSARISAASGRTPSWCCTCPLASGTRSCSASRATRSCRC